MPARGKSKRKPKRSQPKKAPSAKPVVQAAPAKPLEAAATPGAPPQELKALGPPPDDPLAMQAYLHKMLVLSAYDVARDEKISPRERRKELRTIAASAAKLMPRARIHKAEQLVLQNQRELEMKARERRGAKLVPLPPEDPPPAPPAQDETPAPPATEPRGEEPQQ